MLPHSQRLKHVLQPRHSFPAQMQKVFKKGLRISFSKALDLTISRIMIFLIKQTRERARYLVRGLPVSIFAFIALLYCAGLESFLSYHNITIHKIFRDFKKVLVLISLPLGVSFSLPLLTCAVSQMVTKATWRYSGMCRP